MAINRAGSVLTENHSFLSASMTSFLAVAGIRKLYMADQTTRRHSLLGPVSTCMVFDKVCPHLKTLLLVLVTTLMTLLSTLLTVTLDGCRSMMFSGV